MLASGDPCFPSNSVLYAVNYLSPSIHTPIFFFLPSWGLSIYLWCFCFKDSYKEITEEKKFICLV